MNTLSNFPGRLQRMQHIGDKNLAAIFKVDSLSIAERRNCFLALRSHSSEILTAAVFVPLGVTVGELAFAQVLSSNSSRSTHEY